MSKGQFALPGTYIGKPCRICGYELFRNSDDSCVNCTKRPFKQPSCTKPDLTKARHELALSREIKQIEQEHDLQTMSLED